ncbi:hypothetical protein M422DRAFT_245751 [Sphaerobolus stellatus SS14]|nr:hypothetical protein M422DRAFT_245751 [Sphaerobolus stellatus SS14]
MADAFHANSTTLPSYSQMRVDTKQAFGVTPCIGQLKVVHAQMQKKSDVVFISGTGSGKTLTFWMPMLYEKESITILVTPLNLLGKQTADRLQKAGIKAINLTKHTATDEAMKKIQNRDYRLIVVSPELLAKDTQLDKIWVSKKFQGRLSRIIFDEAHCISEWGGTF